MIFQKSALAGNAITTSGKLLGFTAGTYETEDEAEIAYLSAMDCYTVVAAAAVPAQDKAPAKAPTPAAIGIQSSAAVLGAK